MDKLKELRAEKKITQEELAEYLGISCPNYGKKENDQIRFSLEEAQKLSEYFGMSIEDLFFANRLSKIETHVPKKRVRVSKSKRMEDCNA